MINKHAGALVSRKIIMSTGLFIIFFAITAGVSLQMQKIANATGVTGWDAGRIIDDAVFTNYNSMSADQIQSLLNSQVPNCDTYGTQTSEYGGGTRAQWAANASLHPTSGAFYPPFTCLKDYSQDGRTAAQIIYDTAQKYHINPQVFIVLLQKEQGLVTDTWPAPYQYRSATGYGCPDTAPCDSQYYGLVNQIDWSGKMFRKIMDGVPQSEWYTPYVLGTNYIQYNPSSSCGGSNVYIQNRATQALYNYTPYQPNQAALDAGWGSATCGAYGNRNFYLYFTKWFGAATSAATYGYSVISKEFYSDYTYTTKMSDPIVVEPNQEFWAKITIKNTGNQTWYSNNFHLGTTAPQDRSSSFLTSDWLGPNRPASISESYVSGGDTATFMFKMKAPPYLGDYQESFGPLIEWYRWLDGNITIPITVASSSPYYSAKTTSFDTFSDSLMTKKINTSSIVKYTGSKLYVKAVIQNTGNQTLPASTTKIGTSNPIDRTSLYTDNSWQTASRVVSAQGGDIRPGESGTFTFSLTTPNTPQTSSQEQFGLVIENQQWLSLNIGSITLQTVARPPTSLGPNQVLGTNESLVSSDEKYKLILQTDGNLVIYSPTRAVWASHTEGRGGIRLAMQSDGNLVIYNNNWVPVWNTKTDGKGVSSLFMQPDGNLVMYNSKTYTWASWTNEQ